MSTVTNPHKFWRRVASFQYRCHGLNSGPSKDVLSPHSWYLWIWSYLKEGLCGCNPIKMRSLGYSLILCDWCLHKKREMPSEEGHTQMACDEKGRDWSDMAKDCWPSPEFRKRQGKILFYLEPLSADFYPLELWDNTSLLSSATLPVILCFGIIHWVNPHPHPLFLDDYLVLNPFLSPPLSKIQARVEPWCSYHQSLIKKGKMVLWFSRCFCWLVFFSNTCFHLLLFDTKPALLKLVGCVICTEIGKSFAVGARQMREA